ncbi:MAG: DUF1311 domain-containing protein [Caulobacteraceae bacterium]|nr:MAG: DUF1311 domain-containing protein [Caulobacteraceae bacterium]
MRPWLLALSASVIVVCASVAALVVRADRSRSAEGAETTSMAAAPVTQPAPPDTLQPRITAMEAICAASASAEAPATDRPSPIEARQLKDCSPTDDYYGVDERRDALRARKCAFVQLDETRVANYRGGPWGAGVLMMLYAKGEGVKQNLPYARRIACLAGFSQMDVVSLLDAIEETRIDPKAGVDICENIGSGMLGSQCAYEANHRRDLERDGRLARLQRGWPAARRSTWKSVVASRTALEEARIGNEIDTSGTLRGVFIAREEARLRDFDEALLKDLEAGGLKDGSAAAREADKAMNLAYRQVMARTVDDRTWPPNEDVRSTQRVWLRHRDSWRRFAEAYWPGSGDGVVARLTADRRIILRCHLPDPPESLRCERLV